MCLYMPGRNFQSFQYLCSMFCRLRCLLRTLFQSMYKMPPKSSCSRQRTLLSKVSQPKRVLRLYHIVMPALRLDLLKLLWCWLWSLFGMFKPRRNPERWRMFTTRAGWLCLFGHGFLQVITYYNIFLSLQVEPTLDAVRPTTSIEDFFHIPMHLGPQGWVQ